jgi:ligand-binding sensor domain-containing protein
MLEREIIIRMGKQAGIALCVLLACCCCASALDTSLDVDQYAHTAWSIRDRLLKSAITSIAQTPDGYLWLGTEFGLLRFDGVQIVSWQPAFAERLPGNTILSLLAARDGGLWIGTNRGLAAWKNGKLTHYPELAGLEVASLLEDRGGAIWAGGGGISNGRLCAIRGGKTECFGEDGRLGRMAGPFYEDSHRNLWAGTSADFGDGSLVHRSFIRCRIQCSL